MSSNDPGLPGSGFFALINMKKRKGFVMDFINYINGLFPKPPSEDYISSRRQRTVGVILTRYSEGNINLNRGKYVSKKRAKQLKKEALSYHF